MLDRLVTAAVQHRFLVVLCGAGLLVWGLWRALRVRARRSAGAIRVSKRPESTSASVMRSETARASLTAPATWNERGS